jgi:acyl carrier protein
VLADVLGRPVADTDSFASLGGDSLSYVEASVRLERVLGPRGGRSGGERGEQQGS